ALLPGGGRHPQPHRRYRYAPLPVVPADRRIRLLRLATRHAGGRRANSRRQGDHHERPRSFSDEREPGRIPLLPAPGTGGDPMRGMIALLALAWLMPVAAAD